MPAATDHKLAVEEPVRIRLKPRRSQPFFAGHPWVFESAIAPISQDVLRKLQPGQAVEVVSNEGHFVAHGLWNSNSGIRIRLYSWKAVVPFSEELLADRIQRAVRRRATNFDLTSHITGCRLIFSEADLLSGLIVDKYGDFLLVQFTSLALYQRQRMIVDILDQLLKPKGIWLRTERGMREAEGLEVSDGLVRGERPPQPVYIEENELRFSVDVQEGQKTGCYLDQRENRAVAAKYVKGRKVLDAFCFSGGFGITAAKHGGAESVLGIDSSESALSLAKSNAQANAVDGLCEYIRGDVQKTLKELEEQGSRFGAVILDPPRMARTRGGLKRALKGYQKLNLSGLKVLEPDGILVTCSCSGLVSAEQFKAMLNEVSRISGRQIQILEQRGQPCDHPVSVTCPETEYLKVLICRVE